MASPIALLHLHGCPLGDLKHLYSHDEVPKAAASSRGDTALAQSRTVPSFAWLEMLGLVHLIVFNDQESLLHKNKTNKQKPKLDPPNIK